VFQCASYTSIKIITTVSWHSLWCIWIFKLKASSCFTHLLCDVFNFDSSIWNPFVYHFIHHHTCQVSLFISVVTIKYQMTRHQLVWKCTDSATLLWLKLVWKLHTKITWCSPTNGQFIAQL